METVHKTLIFGATGQTGHHVVQHALKQSGGSQVNIFVRNPDKVPTEIRSHTQIRIIKGDVSDRTAVANAVKQVRPDSIIVVSALPSKAPRSSLNSQAVPAMVSALQEIGLFDRCRLVYLSGLFVAPAAEPNPWWFRLLTSLLVPLLGIRAAIEDNRAVTHYLFSEAKGLAWTIVRMGEVKEAPSRGIPMIPVTYFPGQVTFTDMALFLVQLAHGQYKEETTGKAIKAYYQSK